MDKMTYKKALEYAINALPDAPEDVLDKLGALVTSLEKKTENRKPTANQTENAECGVAILEYLRSLEPDDRKTVADLIKEVPAVAGFSSSRVTSIMTALVTGGQVERVVDKRRGYYRAA